MAYSPGLEGVVVKESEICLIDVENSKIYYRGYDLEELAERSSFEETAYLLIYGRLPGASELAEFKRLLASMRRPPDYVVSVMRALPRGAEPIDVLRTAVSAMALGEDLADRSREAELRRGLAVMAAMPYIAANWDRLRRGLDVVDPPAESQAEYFLRILRGGDLTPLQIRAMDAMMVIYAEHSMNNSTFTAVSVASTLSDMYAALTAALASLKGPLHGGANVDAAKMIEEIGSPEEVPRWVDSALASGRRIPGFGHRIYKRGPDPRLKVLRKLAEALAKESGDSGPYEVARRLEEYVHSKLSGKGIFANTDLYASVIFRYLGLPTDLNLPAFAMSRVAGWIAHVLEYRSRNRLIRPTERYVGPVGLRYVPLPERGGLGGGI